MQILRTTYTWPGGTGDILARQSRATESWRKYANHAEYTNANFHKRDFETNASIIYDPTPTILLHHIVEKAFAENDDPSAYVFLANADIGLLDDGWPIVVKRMMRGKPNYTIAVNKEPPGPDDLDWQPRSFFIPRDWWNITKAQIQTTWFPAAWWEDVLIRIIKNQQPWNEPLPPCTWHQPHPMAIIPDHQRPPAVKFNFAMQTGWVRHGYNMPRDLRPIHNISRP